MTSRGDDQVGGEALIVVIAGERHAVAMDRVEEVRVHVGATRIPGAPQWIAGVVERDGRAVELFDAARRLTGSGGQLDDRSCVLFVHEGAAMLVDEIERIVERADLRDVPMLDLESFFGLGEAS